MNYLYKILVFAAIVLCLSVADLQAQTTYNVATVPPLNGGNSSNGVSFNLKANQSVIVKELWSSFYAGTVNVTVWYKTDSINGSPNISTANGWTKVINAQPVTTTTGGYGTLTQIPYPINVTIPAGQTYGFFLECNSSMIYSNTGTSLPSGTQYLFGDGTITINTGTNVGYGGSSPTPVNHPRQYNGKVVYELACATPTGLTISNLQKTSASFTWNAVAPPSLNYEYAVTTSAVPPTSGTTTNSTSINVTNLNAGTNYYIHVRNRCTSNSTSGWASLSFTTPICYAVDTIRVGNVTDTSAIATWNSISIADYYEYVLSTSNIPPVDGSGATTIAGTGTSLFGLIDNTTYYLYIRSRCFSATDSSVWNVASFTTRATCMPPIVNVDKSDPLNSYLSWNDVPSAVAYEYAVTKTADVPAAGTTIYQNNIHVPLEQDGEGRYFHIRTKCYDIFTTSAWATTELQVPTYISEISDKRTLMNVYPNPANSVLNISFNKDVNIGGIITIADVAGKVVYTTAVTNPKEIINISHLSQGIYLLKYSNITNQQVIKLVKK